MATNPAPRTLSRTISFNRSPRIRSAASVNLGANFAQGVDTLQEQVRYLQDQEALDKLPSDPQAFIEYAKTRAKQMGNDPDAAVWQELVKRAQFKVDETAWQQDIRSGAKSLEDFQKYLQDRYNSATPGSVEAQQALYDMDNVKRAIAARSTNAQDQSALYSYLQSGDYTQYIKYLQSKLARAAGQPQVQAVLLKQIQEMQARADRASQTERTQSRADAVTSYLQGGISASVAVARLQQLMQQPGITPGEVSAIGTEISQILQHAKSGSSAAAAQGLTDQLRQAEKDYTDAKAQIQSKVDKGQDVTSEDWARLNTAGQLLQQSYGDVADYYANKGDAAAVKTWTDRQNSVQADIRTTAYNVDKSIIGDVNTATPAFLTGIKNLPSDQQVQSIAMRVAKLNDAATKIKTDQGRTDVQSAIAALQSKADELIQGVKNKDITSTTQAQKDALDHEFRQYKSMWNSGNATTDTPLTQDDFTRELRYSNNAQDFSAIAGITVDASQFQSWKSLVVPQDNRAHDAQQLQDLYNWASQPVSSGPLPYLARQYQSPDATDRNLLYTEGMTQPADTTSTQNPPAESQGKKGLQSLAAVPEATPPAAQESRTTQDQAAGASGQAMLTAGDQNTQEVPTTDNVDKTLNDYLDAAIKFLDQPTPIDIPDVQVLDLPSDTSFSGTTGGGTGATSGSGGSNVNFAQ